MPIEPLGWRVGTIDDNVFSGDVPIVFGIVYHKMSDLSAVYSRLAFELLVKAHNDIGMYGNNYSWPY